LIFVDRFTCKWIDCNDTQACLDAILPTEIEKVLVIDSDVVLLEDVRYFWDEFKHFTESRSEAYNCPGGLALPEDAKAPAIGNAVEMTPTYEFMSSVS